MSTAFTTLEDAIAAEVFPEVDLALRRGRHIGRDDGENYAFLIDAADKLEAFYGRYGCNLIHKSDGYFYLLPTSARLGRRHLSTGEMLVGQALTLLFLDPATVECGGVVTREQVLAQLASVVGTDSLLRTLNPKRRRPDERLAEEMVRGKVSEALRRLASLGFVELVDAPLRDGVATETIHVRLRPALLRFAEPVRGEASPEAALKRLIDEGELVVDDGEPGDDSDDAPDAHVPTAAEEGEDGAVPEPAG